VGEGGVNDLGHPAEQRGVLFGDVESAGRGWEPTNPREGACGAPYRKFSRKFKAFRAHRSKMPYLRAAITLLAYGDQALITRVLRRDCMILAAAASVAVLVKLLTVFEAASPAIRAEAAGRIGVDRIWDTMIAPVVT